MTGGYDADCGGGGGRAGGGGRGAEGNGWVEGPALAFSRGEVE